MHCVLCVLYVVVYLCISAEPLHLISVLIHLCLAHVQLSCHSFHLTGLLFQTVLYNSGAKSSVTNSVTNSVNEVLRMQLIWYCAVPERPDT
jgi:hypothetical protein